MTDLEQPVESLSSPRVPVGWSVGWSEQYLEPFYTNLYDGKSTWEKPSESAPHPTITGRPLQDVHAPEYSDKIVSESDRTGYHSNFDKIPTDVSDLDVVKPSAGEESLLLADFDFGENRSLLISQQKTTAWSRNGS